MKRSWLIWTGFVLCLTVALVAMACVSLMAMRLDRAEADARRQAVLEEKVGRALWRIDSALAPLVTEENVRPWFAYRSFFPADQSYSRMFNYDRTGGERLVPSPLLGPAPPDSKILVHFQFEPDGRLTSPQVPDGANRKLAVAGPTTAEAIRKAQSQLDQVESLLDRAALSAMLPAHRAEPIPLVVSPSVPPTLPPPQSSAQQSAAPVNQPTLGIAQGEQVFGNSSFVAQSPLGQSKEQRAAVQKRRADMQRDNGTDAIDYEARNSLLRQGINDYNGQVLLAQQGALANSGPSASNSGMLPSTDMSGVPMTPLWVKDHLLLARRVAVGGREYVQGCLLDWPAIKVILLGEIGDLLPAADFQPVTGPTSDQSRLLAALPVRLVPGVLANDDDALLSPIALALAVAWTCMAFAALAVAGLLAGVMRLSERRASFVTAVTHELRTPLTTFQMYSEMLAEGMVPDGPQQRQYFGTLRAESVRLTHLVENVLSYARLERGRADGRRESVGLGGLVDRMQGRLAGRAEQAGMQLVVEGDDAARDVTVRANVAAVEQVLFNLVDNACKYAGEPADNRVHLAVQSAGGTARLAIRDHGPGIPPTVRRRLFRPFSKTAREAAHTAPGVGLGLALSRRLARDMGGDLRLEANDGEGACFVLTLPVVEL